jgi:uncharacterized protein
MGRSGRAVCGKVLRRRRTLTRTLRRAHGGHPDPLVARYGYDVKYASRALRLAYQGLEIVRDGGLTCPCPSGNASASCKSNRAGYPYSSMSSARSPTYRPS